ncbi:piwi-like protein Ago3 [Ischnura elegans]|uniref:piwi-like protein Ago3 n=1 Tax=Ischnura elegans TaxID=197161 RepID=UPI001ED8A792|nr:piwi-like protein Ago3 [Ischnura elegans]XP_046398496.1 piwi-like protein Ago3 [Ischnura elegans]
MAFRGGGRGARLLELLNSQRDERPAEEPEPPPAALPTRPVGRGGRGMLILQSLDANRAQPQPPSVEALSGQSGLRQPYENLLESRLAKLAVGPGGDACTSASHEKVKETRLKNGDSCSDDGDNARVESRHGTCGRLVRATCNYINLNINPGMGVFEYEVRFEPRIDFLKFRRALLFQHEDKIGRAKTFDGVVLYLPHKLPDTILASKHPTDGSDVNVKIIFKRYSKMKDTIHLYNVLFKRIMSALEMTRIGRHFYLSKCCSQIPAHKLEVWPGYVTAVDEYEGGVKLCIDNSHRVLRTMTILDTMNRIVQDNPGNYKQKVTNEVMGHTVLTRYNNKTYRIDEIDWNMTPRSKFSGKDNEQVSFLDYYNHQYGIKIRDEKQPLLVSRVKRLQGEQEVETAICLIPELSFMTGLTDEQRADFRLMKSVAVYTRIAPEQRHRSLLNFVKSVNETPKAKALLADWGLSLSPETMELNARELDVEDIIVGGGSLRNTKADFGMDICKREVIHAIHLENWVLLHVQNQTDTANEFVRLSKRFGPTMGIQVHEPRRIGLQNDRIDTYVSALKKEGSDAQVVVIIFPTSRDDRYGAVKKVACCDLGVPTQVINSKTLRNESKVRSVVQKILLQITCKLGGSLWTVKIPLNNVMICGTDVYHDPIKKGRSVGAFISSLNKECTRWYCQTNFMDAGQELVNQFVVCMANALKKFYEINGQFPVKIIIYRDGIGDGQLKVSQQLEIPQFQACFDRVSSGYKPQLTVLIVQKRINTRIFSIEKNELTNPKPGTIVDNAVTRRNWEDFFLVSQSVREGTVTPTHYIILHDSSEMKIDHIQRLTYKLCFMYYNWPGGIRVPAPCQYAHKLAYLTGQHTRSPHSNKLSNKLFFL